MKRLSIIMLALLLASCSGMRTNASSGGSRAGTANSDDYYWGGARYFPGMDPTFQPYYGE